MKYTITADSEPQYGRFFSSSWSCQNWVKYHKANVAKYGKIKADEKVIAAIKNPDATSFGANRAGCFGFDNDFISYFRSVKLYDRLNDGLNGVLSNVGETAITTSNNLTEGVGNLSEGILNTTKLSKYLLPVVLIIVLVVGYKFLNQKLNIS